MHFAQNRALAARDLHDRLCDNGIIAKLLCDGSNRCEIAIQHGLRIVEILRLKQPLHGRNRNQRHAVKRAPAAHDSLHDKGLRIQRLWVGDCELLRGFELERFGELLPDKNGILRKHALPEMPCARLQKGLERLHRIEAHARDKRAVALQAKAREQEGRGGFERFFWNLGKRALVALHCQWCQRRVVGRNHKVCAIDLEFVAELARDVKREVEKRGAHSRADEQRKDNHSHLVPRKAQGTRNAAAEKEFVSVHKAPAQGGGRRLRQRGIARQKGR